MYASACTWAMYSSPATQYEAWPSNIKELKPQNWFLIQATFTRWLELGQLHPLHPGMVSEQCWSNNESLANALTTNYVSPRNHNDLCIKPLAAWCRLLVTSEFILGPESIQPSYFDLISFLNPLVCLLLNIINMYRAGSWISNGGDNSDHVDGRYVNHKALSQ